MTLLDDRSTTRSPGTGRRPGTTRRGASSTRSTSATRSTTLNRDAPAGAQRRPRRTSAAPVSPKPSGVLSGLADVPFIVPIVVLVIGALSLTLYLSTTAAQDSYSLESLRRDNQTLADKRDDLKRTADAGGSAPELAKRAADLGMVPVAGAPHLVVGPDGKARLKGAPVEVSGKPLAPLNPAPDPAALIDPDKVDDSGGLGGQPAPSAEPAAPSPSDGPAPADSRATPAPADPTGAIQAPAPNVLPRAATPGRNTTPRR